MGKGGNRACGVPVYVRTIELYLREDPEVSFDLVLKENSSGTYPNGREVFVNRGTPREAMVAAWELMHTMEASDGLRKD